MVAVLLMGTMMVGSIRPVALRCENLVDPVGIGETTPRLSWKLEAVAKGGRNLRQTAYEIEVAGSPEALRSGASDVWKPGKRESVDTYGIEFGTAERRSGSQRWWRVRVWDQDGTVSDWSEPASWSMGLLRNEDWKAQWIGYDAPRDALAAKQPFAGANWIWHPADKAGEVPAGVERFFEKEFWVSGALAEATLQATADDQFELRLNGEVIAKSDGKTDAWRRPVTVDALKHLEPGSNRFQVRATNTAPGSSGLLVKLVMRTRGGQSQIVASDGSWTVRTPEETTSGPAHVVAPYGKGPWASGAGLSLLLPPAIYLRHEFTLSKRVRRATAYATALGLVELRLNGQAVSEDLFVPGWSDYEKRIHVFATDVTHLVTRGANAAGAILGDGWYAGYIGYGNNRHHYGEHTRALVQIVVENEDGTQETLGTSPDWRAATGPIVESDFLMGERYDATRDLGAWDRPGYDDAKWHKVDTGTAAKGVLEAFPGNPVREYARLKAKAITEPTPGVYVLDLGQNLAGYVELKVRGKKGQTIVMRFAERLNPDGTVYTTNLRGARTIDTYVCRGGGVETWKPRFTFHGFQYVEVTGLDSKPTADTVTGIAISSATPRAGTLETSDPMLNQLVSNAWWTQKMNFIDVPTDCPQRDERLGWTGDAQAYIRTASMLDDVQAFFTKWLVALDDAQRADGQYPMVAPLKVAGGDGGPAWADAGVICPWTIYDVYGDRALLARHYPNMKRFVEFTRARSTPDLLPPKEFHCFGDWVNIGSPTPNEVIYTAYFAYSTDLLARAASELGLAEDVATYRALHARVKSAFVKAYVTPDGVVKGDSQCAYVLALGFDLLATDLRSKAAARLVADIEKRGWHLSTGFVGTRDIMRVLTEIGRNDVAFRLLHNTTFPSWGFTIKNGATSIWERWDGWTPEKGFQDPGMNSFAHYAFGAVVGWMVDQVGGIGNLSPGFGRVLLAPALDPALTWSKASYDSVRGRIECDWRVSAGKLTMRVVVPPNVSAEVRVPATGVTTSEGAVARGEGVFEVGSGEYVFEGTVK